MFERQLEHYNGRLNSDDLLEWENETVRHAGEEEGRKLYETAGGNPLESNEGG